MPTRLSQCGFGLVLVVGVLAGGCGGGGGSSSTGSTGSTSSTSGGNPPPSKAPTAKTISDATVNLGVNSRALLCTSFSLFNRTLVGPNADYYDVPLGLYGTILVGATGVQNKFYLDSARTEPAGSYLYSTNDAAESESGPFSITAGRFTDLSGTYFGAVQSGGVEGSITFDFADGTTQVCNFVENTSGTTKTQTATIGVAEPSGYTQTQKATYNGDGTISVTSKDSNGCQTTLSFAADFTGSGTLTGTDQGLPATVSWSSQGTGSVTFADGSVKTLTNWVLGS